MKGKMGIYPGAYVAFAAGAKLAKRRFYTKGRTSILGGQPRNKGTAKRNVIESGAVAVPRDTRTLYDDELISIPRNDTSVSPFEQLFARQRELCYVAGVKICYEFHNVGTSTSSVRRVNMACIVPRCSNNVNSTDFFRSGSNERAVNFDTSLSSMELNCLNINADEYNIIWRKRFRLLNDNANVMGKFNKTIHAYIPIKRQFRFNDGQTVPECPTPKIVYWFDDINTDGGNPAQTAAIDLTRRIVVYFREPK